MNNFCKPMMTACWANTHRLTVTSTTNWWHQNLNHDMAYCEPPATSSPWVVSHFDDGTDRVARFGTLTAVGIVSFRGPWVWSGLTSDRKPALRSNAGRLTHWQHSHRRLSKYYITQCNGEVCTFSFCQCCSKLVLALMHYGKLCEQVE